MKNLIQLWFLGVLKSLPMDERLSKELLNVVKTSSELLNLEAEDFELLREERNTLSQWTNHIVKTFYDKLFSVPEALKILENVPREALEKTLADWYLSLLNGMPSNDFWKNQWFVGLAHIARGVDNHLMLSMMSLLQETFGDLCFKTYDPQRAWELYKAFKRITDTISSIIVEGYIVLYKVALEGLSGMKPALVDRMAFLEAQKMWKEYKNSRS